MCRICARPTEIFPDGGSPPSYLKDAGNGRAGQQRRELKRIASVQRELGSTRRMRSTTSPRAYECVSTSVVAAPTSTRSVTLPSCSGKSARKFWPT